MSSAGKFALFHLTADGTVQAVEAVNAATEFMGGRRIIAAAQTSYSRADRGYVSIDAGTRGLTSAPPTGNAECPR